MKGAYILLVKVRCSTQARIGALGKVRFEKGAYAYVGSAMNSLEKRIERHFRKEGKRMHWHIDHLLALLEAEASGAWVKEGKEKEECKVAESVAARGRGIAGFGCSDCKCSSHLFKIHSPNTIKQLKGFRFFG